MVKPNIELHERSGPLRTLDPIWEIENGVVKKISADLVADIASCLGVSLDFLMYDDIQETSKKTERTAFFRKYENLSEESKKTIAKIVDALDSDD